MVHVKQWMAVIAHDTVQRLKKLESCPVLDVSDVIRANGHKMAGVTVFLIFVLGWSEAPVEKPEATILGECQKATQSRQYHSRCRPEPHSLSTVSHLCFRDSYTWLVPDCRPSI